MGAPVGPPFALPVFTPTLGNASVARTAAATATAAAAVPLKASGARAGVLRVWHDGPFRLTFGASDVVATSSGTLFEASAYPATAVIGVPDISTHYSVIRKGSTDVSVELTPGEN